MATNNNWFRALLYVLFIPILIISCNKQNSSPLAPEMDIEQPELSAEATTEVMTPEEIMDPMGTNPLFMDHDPEDFKVTSSSKLKTSTTGFEINELTPYTTSSYQNSYAIAISNSGYILGQVYTGSQYRSAIWYNNQITLLENLPNQYNYTAYADDINDQGQSVGYSYTTNNYYHAVIWESDGSVTDLGTLSGATYSYATGINNSGQVTGYSNTSNGQRGFLWDENNGMVDIGLPNSEAHRVVPQAINDNGTIVGYYDAYDSNNQWYRGAFTWNEIDGFTDYLGFGQATTNNMNVIPRDINNNGQIVGDAYNLVDHENGAFFFDPVSGFTSLNNDGDSNTYYYALGLNNDGIVAGYYYDYNNNYTYSATQWDEQNGLIDLGVLNPDYYSYSVAYDINDNAEVVGYSYDENGYLTAVIWNGDGSGGSGTTNNTYISDSGTMTWDAILPSTEDPNWVNTVCYQGNDFGLNANWVNPHNAFVVTQDNGSTHPWDNGTFDAEWINSYNSMNSSASNGPGGHNWSKYETQVSGNGDFVIQLLADNCSWVYLADENGDNPQLIGYQPAVSTPGEYGVTLDGDHTLTFVIFDGGGLAGGKFRLETTEDFGGTPPPPIDLNTAPVADAGTDQSVEATGVTTSVTLDGTGSSDADDDPLTYSWTMDGNEIATGSTPSVDLERGNYTITLTVSDGEETDSDEVSIEVYNTAPVADAGSDQSIEATGHTTSVQLDGSGSTDANNDPLTYSWSLNGSEVATGATPSLDLERDTYTFVLTVDDGYGATNSDEVTVEVYNTPPVADGGSDQTFEATRPTSPVSLSGSGTDANGDALTFSWSLDGNEVATSGDANFDLAPGTYVFTLTVDDGYGGSDNDEVTVTITDTTAPDLTFTTETNSLWPPNHKMVLVVSGISAYDIVDEATDVEIVVTSNEDANGNGDGNTDEDYEILANPDGSYDVYVRAERSGNGNGRVYTISFSTSDVAGNSSGDTVEVSVAGNQGNGKGGKKK